MSSSRVAGAAAGVAVVPLADAAVGVDEEELDELVEEEEEEDSGGVDTLPVISFGMADT